MPQSFEWLVNCCLFERLSRIELGGLAWLGYRAEAISNALLSGGCIGRTGEQASFS